MTQIPSVSSNDRSCTLASRFLREFGVKPQICARAPGRVNIIGEHIDYCGFSVLPMALEQDIMMAAAPRQDHGLKVVNVDSGKYCSLDSLELLGELSEKREEWFNYVRCGILGVRDWAQQKDVQFPSDLGLNILVDGSIPPSAGLSSSSAMVCVSAMITMRAAGFTMSAAELADVCVHCEHYVGTEGGGMDQTIAMLAETGTAKFIIFTKPVQALPVRLPQNVRFVVAHSGVVMNKAASSQFNERVVECRVAAQLLAALELGIDKWRDCRTLADTARALGRENQLSEMTALVDQRFKQKVYTREQLISVLHCTEEEFARECLSATTQHMQEFHLRQRATHVYSEAARVLAFRAACDCHTELSASQDVSVHLGELMSASHMSCRDDYQCSHPQLDQLVNSCVVSGALGARLTGAGWGGCAVALVRDTQVEEFLHNIRANFYEARGLQPFALFATQPAGGARFLEI